MGAGGAWLLGADDETFIYVHQHGQVKMQSIHAPKLPSALLGAPTATTVTTPPVGVHIHEVDDVMGVYLFLSSDGVHNRPQ